MAGGGKPSGSDSGLAGEGVIDFVGFAFEQDKESNATVLRTPGWVPNRFWLDSLTVNI